MPEILINVINKIPVLSGDIRQITADNSDYTIRFVFDGDWTDGPKTVYFVRQNGFAFPTGRTDEDKAAIPVVRGVQVRDWLYIGVQQGDVKTSRPCGIPVYKSITDMIDDDAVQPDESLWESVILRIEELEKNGASNCAPLYLSGVLDDAGRYRIDGYTVSQLDEMSLGREIHLTLSREDGVIVFADWRHNARFTGTAYRTGGSIEEITSINVVLEAQDNDDGSVGVWGNVVPAPAEGTGSGGVMVLVYPAHVPCENYAAQYVRLPIVGDEAEKITPEEMAAVYASGGLTVLIAGDDPSGGSMHGVLRPAPLGWELGTMDFAGEYQIDSDVPADVVPVTPITATIKPDGTLTIRLAETRPSVLYLQANGSVPGRTGAVIDHRGAAWTAESLRDAMLEYQLMLNVFQDVRGAPGEEIYTPGRTGMFRLYSSTGGNDGKPIEAVFHGHYWGDDLDGWVPAVAVIGEDGRCTVTDAAWDSYAKQADVDGIAEAVADLEESKADGIIETATGEVIAVSDSAKSPLRGLTVYGKSVQDGTPTPDAPVPIVSVGGDGEITLAIEGGDGDTVQTLPISTPDGLCGIPVTSGGNYTDANGQQWVCDTVDFVRGVYVRRTGVKVFDGTETYSKNKEYQFYSTYKAGQMAFGECLSTVLRGSPRDAYNAQKSDVISVSGNTIWLYSTTLCTNANDIKAYFAAKYAEGNPAKLYYQLGTPIETPLTESELAAYKALYTNHPNTTIYADDNAGLAVQYKADTKLYIDKKFDALAAAVLANA